MLFVVKMRDGFEYFGTLDKPSEKAWIELGIAAILAWPNRPQRESEAYISLTIAEVKAEHGKLMHTTPFDFDIHPVELPDDELDFRRSLTDILKEVPAEVRTQFKDHYELLRETGVPSIGVLKRARTDVEAFLKLWAARDLFASRGTWWDRVCFWWRSWQRVADLESGQNPATSGQGKKTGWKGDYELGEGWGSDAL